MGPIFGHAYLERCLSSLASFFFLRFSFLSFFVGGFGFPPPLASPRMPLKATASTKHGRKPLISLSEMSCEREGQCGTTLGEGFLFPEKDARQHGTKFINCRCRFTLNGEESFEENWRTSSRSRLEDGEARTCHRMSRSSHG